MKYLLFFSFFIILISYQEKASACVSCSCGDSTLTLMGQEIPYKGRLRFSFDFQYRHESSGENEFYESINEFRLGLGTSYSVTSNLNLGFYLPFVKKELKEANLKEEHALGHGDLELRAKLFLYRDKLFSPNHLLGMHLGLRLPSGEKFYHENGDEYSIDVQPGSGSLVPSVGFFYNYFNAQFSSYVSTTLLWSSEGWQEYQVGLTWLATFYFQYQASDSMALALSFDPKWSQKDNEFGKSIENTGGFLMMVSPQISMSISEDVLFYATIRIPIVNELNGSHDESITYYGGIAYDL